MRILGCLLIAWFLASPVLAEESVYDRAARLDPMGNADWRPMIKGEDGSGYQSPFGIQIHPACFRYLSDEYGVSDPVAVARFADGIFRDVFESMMGCQSEYPELSPYLSAWLSQFRRTVIDCSPPGEDFGGRPAMNIAADFLANYVFDRYALQGLDPQNRAGYFGSMANNHVLTIGITSESLHDAMTKGKGSSDYTWLKDLLSHEVLHATRANNRTDHDSIEDVYGGPSSCDPDISWDRINVISTLCVNGTLYGYGGSTAAILFKKMVSCGSQFCPRLFTSESETRRGPINAIVDPVWNSYLPSRGLSAEAADTLCARLYDRGGREVLGHAPLTGVNGLTTGLTPPTLGCR